MARTASLHQRLGGQGDLSCGSQNPIDFARYYVRSKRKGHISRGPCRASALSRTARRPMSSIHSRFPAVNPPRERMFNVPGAVLALAALLLAIHLILEYVLDNEQTNELLSLFAFSPLRYAEVVPRGLPAWWGPQLWTFVSYAFLHANFSHLIFNLIWLMAFGPPIARRFGPWRF